MAKLVFTQQLRRFTDLPELDTPAGLLRDALDAAFAAGLRSALRMMNDAWRAGMKPIRDVLLSLSLLLPNPCAAADRIVLYYNVRPPYLVPMADGSVSGLTGTPADHAFKAAGIPFVWSKMPTNRQLLNIKTGVDTDCGIGWFKNREREQFAKFTKAIYRDSPTVGLANKSYGLRQGASLQQALMANGARVLAKDNYSYGPFIDGLLSRLRPDIVRTTNENSLMVEMIRLNRADFMFVAEEEADFLVQQAGSSINEFRLIHFSDMPPGEKRYIMCSKRVPDDVIDRLNKAIDFE